MTLTQEERRELEDAFPPLPDRTLTRLRAKLNQWELVHLRQHCADLAMRLETAESEHARLVAQLSDAERRAEYWHEQCTELINSISGELQIVMSQVGDLRASVLVAP